MMKWFNNKGAHSDYIKAATAKFVTLPILRPTQQSVVLYVEDNLANLRLIEQLLSRLPDMQFLIAKNGRDGIDQAISSVPDVILMEINQSSMDADVMYSR